MAKPTYLVNSQAVGDRHGDHLPSLCIEPGGLVHLAWQTRDAFVGDLDPHESIQRPEPG